MTRRLIEVKKNQKQSKFTSLAEDSGFKRFQRKNQSRLERHLRLTAKLHIQSALDS